MSSVGPQRALGAHGPPEPLGRKGDLTSLCDLLPSPLSHLVSKNGGSLAHLELPLSKL